jgi:signal transduction histidine kinase
VASEIQHGEVLAALAAHLRARREAILAAWRQAVDADPHLKSASALSRSQFIDHVPEMLDTFERRLTAESDPQKRAAVADQKEGAAAHGLQRWQQGYNQRETARDWGHLQMCLLAELESFEATLAVSSRTAMQLARRALVRLINDGVSESAGQYAQMRQAEAAMQVAELERALKGLAALQEQRAGIWREAAHDLRGSVGVLQSASTVLDWEGAPEAVREQSLQVLKRGVQSLHDLLSDLIDLARLDAGHDRLALETFDVSATLRDLCESLRALANERNLFLRVIGPNTLEVQSDRIKIVRVAQNLLLNALRYTHAGGVTLEWQAEGTPQRPRWRMAIIDSGPGITQTSSAPIVQALDEATRAAQRIGREPRTADVPAGTGGRDAQAAVNPAPAHHGEGIGLTIVKRLCELLEATVELESRPDGTTVRVTLPQHYA